MAKKKKPLTLDALKGAKWPSALPVMFRASRLIYEILLAYVRERSGRPIRYAHAALLPHIDVAGTRQTVIAERLGISKQAVGQLVDDLEEMDFVIRMPAPDDARAKLVCFNATTNFGFAEALGVIQQLENVLAKHVGKREMKEFFVTLNKILELVDAGGLTI